MGGKELMGEKVTVRYNGEEYLVPRESTEDQIREALRRSFPEVANARITKEESGDWTVTREAGQKGQ